MLFLDSLHIGFLLSDERWVFFSAPASSSHFNHHEEERASPCCIVLPGEGFWPRLCPVHTPWSWLWTTLVDTLSESYGWSQEEVISPKERKRVVASRTKYAERNGVCPQ